MLESIYGAQTLGRRAGGGNGGDALGSYLKSVGGQKPALGFSDPNVAADNLVQAARASGATAPMASQAPHGIGAGGGPATAPGLGDPSQNSYGSGPPGQSDVLDGKLPDWLTQLLSSRTDFAAAQKTPAITPTDYSNDPALQALLMGFDKTQADAESHALTAERNTVARYGDVNLAKKLLGANDPIIGTISADPDKSTSTLARLARAYRDTVQSNENDLNTNNLFYGGYRTKTLGNLAKDEQTQEADASSAVQDALEQIGNGLQTTLDNISGERQSAEADAYKRAVEAAIAQAQLTSGKTTPDGLPDGPAGSAYDSSALMAYLKSLGINGIA